MVRSSINPLNPLAGARLHYYSFPAAVISRSIPMKDKLGEIVLRWRIHTPTSVMLHPPVAVRDIVFRRFWSIRVGQVEADCCLCSLWPPGSACLKYPQKPGILLWTDVSACSPFAQDWEDLVSEVQTLKTPLLDKSGSNPQLSLFKHRHPMPSLREWWISQAHSCSLLVISNVIEMDKLHYRNHGHRSNSKEEKSKSSCHLIRYI